MKVRLFRIVASLSLTALLIGLLAWGPDSTAVSVIPECGAEANKACIAVGCTGGLAISCAELTCMNCYLSDISFGIINQCFKWKQTCGGSHPWRD